MKAVVAVCIAFVLSTAALATEIAFGPQEVISSIDGEIWDVVEFDGDGDGDPDLLVAAGLDATSGLLYFENDGNGAFGASRIIRNDASGLNNPRHPRLADIDGDGDLDIFSEDGPDTIWLKNFGDASFGAPRAIREGAGSSRDGGFDLGDMDGDGDLDVVITRTGGVIAWVDNTDGNGGLDTFSDTVIASGLSGPIFVVAADVDGDSDLDVISGAEGDSSMRFHPNNGDGTFGSAVVMGAANAGLQAVRAADIDGDGDIDGLSCNNLGSTHDVEWFENLSGGGAIWATRTAATEPNTTDLTDVRPFDMDGDGDVDLLMSHTGLGRVAWYENNAGDGSSFTRSLIGEGDLDTPRGSFAMDVDRDGDLDLLVGSTGDTELALYENRKIHRNMQFVPTTLIGSSDSVADSLTVGDVDGDGDLDIVEAGDVVRLFRNTAGDGSAWSGQTIWSPTGRTGGTAMADIDGDGDMDVLGAELAGGAVAWIENTAGDGSSWTPRTIPATGAEAYSVNAADVDGDGDQDVITTMVSGDLAWHQNTAGDGTAWTERVIDNHFTNFDNLPVDMDRDGDVDIVNIVSFGAVWFENLNGNGTSWASRTIGTLAGNERVLSGGDLDHDGDFDVVIASDDLDIIEWYENLGGNATSWAEHTISTTADGVWEIAVRDMDGDGDSDVVSASGDSDEVLVHENVTGDGLSWGIRNVDILADRPQGLDVGDVDGDGRIDVIFSARHDFEVNWTRNQGGQFDISSSPAETQAPEGEETPFLSTVMQVHGRSGDPLGELESLRLRFQTPGDVALTTGEATALIAELKVYRDNGDLRFDPAVDALVSSGTVPSLVNGEQVLTMNASDINNILIASPARYYVVGAMTANAALQTPSQFTVRHFNDQAVLRGEGALLEPGLLSEYTTATITAVRTFDVGVTGDAIDANAGDGICATAGAQCTLRAAVMEANAWPGPNQIRLDETTYTLALGGSGEDLAQTGDLDITDATGSLTIVGKGAGRTIIQGDGVDRVFHSLQPATPFNFSLVDLTIRGGAGAGGGALLAAGSTNNFIIRCELRDNEATGVAGGALRVLSGASVNLMRSTLHTNTGDTTAHTVWNEGQLWVDNSTLSQNNGPLATTVTVVNSGLGNLTLRSSTISGNTAGIANLGGSSVQIGNTIVAGNTNSAITGDDLTTGTFSNFGGYNLIGENAGTGLTDGISGNQVGTAGAPINAELIPLGDNGGETMTMALGPTSPALDAGAAIGSSEDQRGQSRCLNIPGIPNVLDSCDIGAYEARSGQVQNRAELPIRWCGMHGAPSIDDPTKVGATTPDEVMRSRHERASESIYVPQANVALRSAGNFEIESYPLLEDPDCTEEPPGVFTCTNGDRGDVMLDVDEGNFDEFQQIIADCRAAWEALDPNIQGITAVHINTFVGPDDSRLDILGVGGRAAPLEESEQALAGRLMVTDNLYRMDLPTNPDMPPVPEDVIDRLLAHEAGHALSLEHGDGEDNDNDGIVDNDDDKAVGLPRFDGPNLMQYRNGTTLSPNQITRMRDHLEGTVPDVDTQPIEDTNTGAAALDEEKKRILQFGFDGLTDLPLEEILEYAEDDVLEFEAKRILQFEKKRILQFEQKRILQFEAKRILQFGMDFGGMQMTDKTRVHGSMGSLPWPAAIRPDTRYYFYLDTDRDDGTGGYPAESANPDDPPNNFPGFNNVVGGDDITVEYGVDLIIQVTLKSSCPGQTCDSTSTVKAFKYILGTGVYEETFSEPNPKISAVGVGLYIDNGGEFVEFDDIPVAMTIQPEIPNSVLFDAGWGYTMSPSGEPIPNPIRMEAVTTIECSGHILNNTPSSASVDCQCTNCMDCPKYPGCDPMGVGDPMDLTGSRILTDCKDGEVTFDPPLLPSCSVAPMLANEAATVTVFINDLPTDVVGQVEVTLDDVVLATAPTSSIAADGSIAIMTPLPSGATGDLALRTGLTGLAPRAECVVTATPAVPCPDNDADGDCDDTDPDDDNDTVPDGSDLSPTDPSSCRDVDGDTCDDCTSGTDAPLEDGADFDLDGICDAGDDDDDNDGIDDVDDGEPTNPNACGDSDFDLCDDCEVSATPDPANDGSDNDGDGACDRGDPDDDNDGVPDTIDGEPFDPALCGDSDADLCDDCDVTSQPNPANDGPDSDADGLCDLGDPDDDNDGTADGGDCAPFDNSVWSIPGEIPQTVGLSHVRATEVTTLSWDQPVDLGSPIEIYDTIRTGAFNDSCTFADGMAPNTTVSGTTVGQFQQPPTLDCGVPISAPGVWYEVHGTGQLMRATTCHPGTDYDTIINVYCADCTNPTCVSGNDDTVGGYDPACDSLDIGVNRASTIGWCSQFGATYFIHVQGFNEVGNFELSVTEQGACGGGPACTTGLPNTCDTPEAYATSGESVILTNSGGSDPNPPAFACGTDLDPGPGVWTTIIGTGEQMVATTCAPGTDFDTRLHVYCVNCNNLRCVDGNDDDPVGNDPDCELTPGNFDKSTVTWCSEPGAVYRVLVTGVGGASGTAQLTMFPTGQPCTGAVGCRDVSVCEEKDGPDRQTIDGQSPQPGDLYQYLIRATNSCGLGTVGTGGPGGLPLRPNFGGCP